MVCKSCGVHYSNRNELLCSMTLGHIWPELNEPVPAGGYESAQPCGCDKGANWTCQWHQIERRIEEQQEHG
jgi:hypothetical protein